MRKNIIILGLLFSVTAFAQQNKPDPNSVDKMQQLLNQSASQAVVQFNKTYTPPRISSSTGATTTTPSPAVAEQQAAPTPVSAPRPSVSAPTSSNPSNNNPKSPDITVSADKSSGSVGNIYAAGGDQSNNGIRY